MKPKGTYTSQEAANILGINKDSVRRVADRENVYYERSLRQVYFDAKAIDKLKSDGYDSSRRPKNPVNRASNFTFVPKRGKRKKGGTREPWEIAGMIARKRAGWPEKYWYGNKTPTCEEMVTPNHNKPDDN